MWYLWPNFSVKSNSKRHIVGDHERKKKIWMSFCNQKISLQKNLRMHSSEIHQVKKPLKCDICDHCFSQNGSLKIHMLPVHDENKTFKCELVITALLTRAVWLNTLLQFTMLRNHSNVTFVIPFFTKRNTLLRFMKVRNLLHVMYLCYQSYLKKESLRRHISAVQWKVIWSKRHILSVHEEKTKLFKCSICEALVLINLPLDSTSTVSFTGIFSNR